MPSRGERADNLFLLDQLLFEQGAFNPLEFLLASGALSFADYEDWRLGRRPTLLPLVHLEPTLSAPDLAQDLASRIEDLHSYAHAQGLVAKRQPLESWGDSPQPLSIGGAAMEGTLTDLLSTCFEPNPQRTQLDLFHDSSASLLEARIRTELGSRRIQDAQASWRKLAEQCPAHRHLADWQRLIAAPDALTKLADTEARWRELESIADLALSRLAAQARNFLSPLWAALAVALAEQAAQPNDEANPARHHPAAAWARAEHWQEVRNAIEVCEHWRTDAELVHLHALACWRQRDQHRARADWLWLCWAHPEQASRCLRGPDFPDRPLNAAWIRFEDADTDLQTEDFPAWLQLTAPGLMPASETLTPTDPDHAATFQIVRELQANPDSIALRENLDGLHAELLRVFLATRRPNPDHQR